MTNKRKIGFDYEDIAAKFLESKGYKIIAKNFTSKSGEIDIIAADNDYLIFVEVKYRKNDKYGHPLESINYKKQQRIINTSKYYMLINNYDENTPVRYDVVGIFKDGIILLQDSFSL